MLSGWQHYGMRQVFISQTHTSDHPGTLCTGMSGEARMPRCLSNVHRPFTALRTSSLYGISLIALSGRPWAFYALIVLCCISSLKINTSAYRASGSVVTSFRRRFNASTVHVSSTIPTRIGMSCVAVDSSAFGSDFSNIRLLI